MIPGGICRSLFLDTFESHVKMSEQTDSVRSIHKFMTLGFFLLLLFPTSSSQVFYQSQTF